MDCYNCIHRRNIPGSAHSSCAHKAADATLPLVMAKAAAGYSSVEPIPVRANGHPIVLLDKVGVRGGWALWPFDYDPIWITQCLLYEGKDNQGDRSPERVSVSTIPSEDESSDLGCAVGDEGSVGEIQPLVYPTLPD